MADHSPGPWTIERCRLEAFTPAGFPQDCRIVAGPEKQLVAALVAYQVQPEAVMLADARLIAAAPDLLAALEAVLPYYCAHLRGVGADPNMAEIVIQARAAIAKAKGGGA